MIQGIGWLGVRTDRFDEMVRFYRDVMHLTPTIEIPRQFALFDLPGGDRVELFSADGPFNSHFPAVPVGEFLVDDVDATRLEMEAAGVVFLHVGRDDTNGVAWAHYRAPDRNLYGITHRKSQT